MFRDVKTVTEVVDLHVRSCLFLAGFDPKHVDVSEITTDLISRHGIDTRKILAACQVDYLARQVGSQWLREDAELARSKAAHPAGKGRGPA